MQAIEYEAVDGVALITINRPERGNALDDDARAGIRAAWAKVNDDADIAVAILTGAGDRHFCTGADVNRLNRERQSEDVETQRNAGPGGWSSRHYGVRKPVICAVNGLATGGGLHFVVDADIVLGSSYASFTDTHVNIGQVGALENIGLAKRLPLGTALRITLMGKAFRLTAARAYQLGLLDEIYNTRDEMLKAALEMAQIMRRNSPQAMMLSKQAIWDSLDLSYEQALTNGWNLICDQRTHRDAREGVAAFAEKRSPQWQNA